MGILETEDVAWLTRLRCYGGPPVFVETGTHTGKLTKLALQQFAVVHTVELSADFAARYHPELKRLGAHCWHGDSAVIVPQLATSITEPVLWFLDAHWVPGMEGAADGPLPLMAELEAIAQRSYADLIVVDDVNCFGHGPQADWQEITSARIVGLFPNARYADPYDQLIIAR